MSQRSDISASIQANFPDNTSQFITPQRIRNEQYTFLNDTVLNEQTASIIAQAVASSSASPINTGSLVTTSSFNAYTASTNTFTGSIQTQVNTLQAATSSYVTNAITASSLITASVSLNTITFTKGNGTTFPITVNTGSGGSSFPFSGSAQITGSLGVTGSIEGSNQNGLKINLGSGNTIPNVGANGNGLAFGNSITNNTQNNGFAFGDSHTIANPGYNNFIAGGNTNTLNNNRGFAGGGLNNTINNIDGAIIGGSSNTVNHDGAIILGGNGQTTIDDQTVHMNRANIGDFSSGNYVSFNNSGSNDVDFFATSLTMNDNSVIEVSGSTIPAVLRVNASNYLDLKTGAWISTNLGGFSTGSVGQVLTRSGSSIVWATPVTGSGGTVDTGSLATTGSNTFNGTNTFTGSVNIQSASITFLTVDTIVSSSTINNTGSNQLGDTLSDTQTLFGTLSSRDGNMFMSTGSTGQVYSTGSAGQFPNIIFPRVGAASQSGSATFTGKNNILMNPGFNSGSYFSASFGGNSNVIVGNVYWTASAQQPVLNQNYFAGNIFVTGSNSSAIHNNTFTSNNINGAIILDLSKATGSNAASLTATNNVINGSLTVSSSISGSTTFNIIQFNNNNIAGGAQSIRAAGAGRTSNTQVLNNFIGGFLNTVSLEGASTAGTGIANALIYGSNLVYSGSSSANNSSSSVILGQFNETGSLALDSQIRFAIGNGANTGSRSTPFYVSASGDIVMRLPGQNANSIFKGDIVDINGRWNGSPNTLANNATAIASTQVNMTQSIGSVAIATQAVAIGGSYTGAQVTGSAALADFSGDLGGTNWVALVGNYDSTIRNSSRALVAATSASFMSSSANSAIIAGQDIRMNNGNSTVALGRDTAYTASAAYTLFTQNVDISGSLTVNGNKQYNYGEFWATSSNTPAAGVSQSVIFDSTGVSAGVATSGSGDLLKITNAGTYNIQFSVQVNTSAGADTLYVWFKKNGTNIAASNSKAVLANNTAQLLTANILDTAAANDYYEIVYQTSGGNAQILSEAATGNLPAIPSVITTITQVA